MAKKSLVKSVSGYFGGVVKEGKKVRWADAETVVRNTVMVLGYVVFMAAIFYVANLFITLMFGLIGL